MNSNITRLEMAIEGKIDFIKKTNPWGSKDDKDEEELLKQVPAPERAMNQLINIAKRLGDPRANSQKPKQKSKFAQVKTLKKSPNTGKMIDG